MARSKKIFILLAILFFLFLIFVAYDFSTRTTFPGSHRDTVQAPALRDSVPSDSASENALP